MDRGLEYALLTLVFIVLVSVGLLSRCSDVETTTMWSCDCDLTCDGHEGPLTFPVWCDDEGDRYSNGAMVHGYCWEYASITCDVWNCSCDCTGEEVKLEDCY